MTPPLPRWLLFTGIAGGLLAAAWPDGTTVAPMPPPTHTEWRYLPVGRWLLMNPTVTDSTGKHPVVVIPEGAVLAVPVTVRGADPEVLRHES